MHNRILCVSILLAAASIACSGQSAAAPTPDPADPAAAGAQIFESLGCIHCHEMDGEGPGPSLVGIYGQSILLESGETITVDEGYIRQSILDPQTDLHAGYKPIMPSFEGQISEEEMSRLIEYIRSLE